MSIDQKALGEATDAILMRVPFGYGMTKPEAGRYAEAAITAYLASLPASDHPFPSHRFDGAMEVPSYTSNSSAPAHEHAGLVEKEIRTLLCSFVAEHFPENNGWKPLPDLLGMISQLDNAITIARDYRSKLEAATALSAGVRAYEVGQTLNFFASVIKSGEPWTSTCETEFRKAHIVLKALSDAPVVTEDSE